MPDGIELPHNLPIETARLPATYETAKMALARCDRLDECQDWADKAAALASYARQANDVELRNMCVRIQDRAVRRCGELLKQIPPGKNRFDRGVGTLPSNRSEAATEAGLSEHQRKTALRVANVPEEEFDEAVEGDQPPTLTELAKLGTKPAEYLKGRDPSDFEQATRLIGLFDWIEQRRAILDLDAALRGLTDPELETVSTKLRRTLSWLSGLEEAIDGL